MQKDETLECKRDADQKIMNEDIKYAIKKYCRAMKEDDICQRQM